MLYETKALVKSAVLLSYGQWKIKPEIETDRDDYISFRVPDGSLIEAFKEVVYNYAEHL